MDKNNNSPCDNEIRAFLTETEQYIDAVDSLSFETAAELYDLLNDAGKVATINIKEIDPELRVTICDRQDKVLDRIADVLPPFEKVGEPMSIFSPQLELFNTWYNFQIMKDCGLVGYLLAREIGAKPTMFFGNEGEEYSYLDLLPGLEMLYRKPDENPEESYVSHLEKNYHEMDILVLYGMYQQSLGYLNAYRLGRPEGKVYCGLDMNTFWQKNVDWDDPAVHQFQGNCDVIATSCRKMRDILNRTQVTRFPCYWIPNGFYNPYGIKIVADAEYKENTILMVGRVGDGQKNNEELMLGFAAVASKLSGWTLRFVGPVDPKIEPFLEWYFKEYPALKERVIFTGRIVDKAELYDEYARAKIFALSSRTESGTPNVYSEALFHGCKFLTSDVDGADDMTNFGELGEVYTRGDIKGLAEALIKVCSNTDVNAFKRHIPKALAYAERYYDWNRIAKKLAFMLFN